MDEAESTGASSTSSARCCLRGDPLGAPQEPQVEPRGNRRTKPPPASSTRRKTPRTVTTTRWAPDTAPDAEPPARSSRTGSRKRAGLQGGTSSKCSQRAGGRNALAGRADGRGQDACRGSSPAWSNW
jgi:hypothetical protein